MSVSIPERILNSGKFFAMAIHASSSSRIAFTAADWKGGLNGLSLGSATGKLDGLPKTTGELVGSLVGLSEIIAQRTKLRSAIRETEGECNTTMSERVTNIRGIGSTMCLVIFLTSAVRSSRGGSRIENRCILQTVLR